MAHRARAVLVALAAIALSACDSGTALGSVLVGSVDGYALSGSSSGPLDASGAAQSLPSSVDTTSRALDSAGFSGGYARVFLSNAGSGDYVLVSVYAVASPAAASGFVATEKRALVDTGSVQAFSDARIAGSAGFILTGPTRRGARDVFCAGLLFPRSARVYAVTTCSAMPEDTVLATQVAEKQAASA